MPKAAFTLSHPERRTTSVVFASPHSGRDYPWSFVRRTNLNELSVRSSEDAFVDDLFEAAPRNGAPFIKAARRGRSWTSTVRPRNWTRR